MQAIAYELFADVLSHPGPGFPGLLSLTLKTLAPRYPTATRAMERFRAEFPLRDLKEMQEAHTRSFDVQAITTLDIGYVLFGEDYKRGALLANLSAEHTKANNDCGRELADHLTNVLRLLPKIADTELRRELVEVLLAPALREMIRDFEPARMAKKEELYKKHHKTLIDHPDAEHRGVYRHVLEALYEVLRADFGLKASLPLEQESSFGRAVESELRVEGSEKACASGA